nr:T9SS type A sorting domain-containing protein [FCB group bacterium]
VGGTSSYGAGNTDVYLIRLEAEYPSPEIGLSADSLLFPETVIGFTTELPITIYNIGTADLSVDSMFFEQYPDVFSVGWIPGDDIISRGDSLEITVYFTPVDAIEYVDILNICNNDELAVVVVLGNPYAPILWTQTFGGGSDDYSECVQQTMDGGYIIAGTTSSYGTGYDSDVYLIKTDGIGNESWYQTFGGSDSEWGQSVQQTTDGGYIIAGHTESYGAGGYDVYLIKTDENGNELWSQTFGGVGWDDGYSVQQTTDGGYIVAGTTSSYGTGNDDFYLIKTDGNGNEAWSQTFGGTGADWGHGVQQTTDGGYILAGYTGSYGAGGGDFYLIKTDGDGNETWSRTFGGTGPEYGYSVQQTTDGGYIIAGRTGSYGALGTDVYLIKTDNNGIEVWSQTFGGSGWDCGYSVQQTSDGGYIIAGQTSSYGAGNEDFYLIKTDADGDSIWTKTFGGSSDDVGKSVQQTTDGGYIIAGYTDSFGVSESDVYLICLEGELGVEEHFGSPHPSEFILYPAYPNPFNPSTTLSFSLPTAGEVALNVYNIQGREVAKLIDGFQPAGSHQVTFDAKNLTSGVYFVRLEAGDFSQTEKLLLIK